MNYSEAYGLYTRVYKAYKSCTNMDQFYTAHAYHTLACRVICDSDLDEDDKNRWCTYMSDLMTFNYARLTSTKGQIVRALKWIKEAYINDMATKKHATDHSDITRGIVRDVRSCERKIIDDQ